MMEVRGEESVETLFARLNTALEQLPENEREPRRISLSERIRQGVQTRLSIMEAWDAWLSTPKKRSPGRDTIEMYRAYWGRESSRKRGVRVQKNGLTHWLAEHHPQVKYLHQITPAIAEEYATHLWKKGIAPRTYNGTIKFLRSMFDTLVARAGLTSNVWKDFPMLEMETESRRNLTDDELRAVCNHASGDLRYWIAIGLYTGLRLGDVITLKWSEIDFAKGQITRIPRKTRRKRKSVSFPLHPVLRALLEELKASSKKGEKYLFPEAAANYERSGASTITRHIQAHFAACGIRTTKEGTGFTYETNKDGRRVKKSTGRRAVVEVGFHSLRHSFVSLCAANNVPQHAIQELVGHGSPAMTMLYSHADDEQKASAINVLPALTFADAETAPVTAETA